MKATLCDICGKQINSEEAGARVTEVGNVNKHAIHESDLCATHYREYRNTVSRWTKQAKNIAQGGMP